MGKNGGMERGGLTLPRSRRLRDLASTQNINFELQDLTSETPATAPIRYMSFNSYLHKNRRSLPAANW
jgi:hypothetical protein